MKKLGLITLLAALFVFALALLGLPSQAQTEATPNNSAVIATIPLGSSPSAYQPRGIAVNTTTNRIYVSLGMGDGGALVIIDGATNSVIATIRVGIGAIGVSVNEPRNVIYVANYYSNSVSVIDGATNTISKSIPVGAKPWGVAYNPQTDRLYVTNWGDNTVSVFDGSNDNLLTTITVDWGPNHLAINPSTNRIYVSNSTADPHGRTDTVSVVDGTNNSVLAAVPVGNQPLGLAVSTRTDRVFVTNSGVGQSKSQDNVTIIDGATHEMAGRLSSYGGAVDAVVNPVTHRVYVANSSPSGLVAIFDEDTLAPLLPAVPFGRAGGGVGEGWVSVAVNAKTNRVYVAAGSSNVVSVIGEGPAVSLSPTPTTALPPSQLPAGGGTPGNAAGTLPLAAMVGGGAAAMAAGLLLVSRRTRSRR